MSFRASNDLLSRASLDLLQQRLMPAIADARRATDALFLRLPAAGGCARRTAPAGRQFRH